jgi:hypothetical protein
MKFLRRLLGRPALPPTHRRKPGSGIEAARRRGGAAAAPRSGDTGTGDPAETGPVTGGWMTSSMDLLDGADIVEVHAPEHDEQGADPGPSASPPRRD